MDLPVDSTSMKVLQSSTLISQGAEAKVYKGALASNGRPILLKHRFKKKYRHTTLDASLTKSRVSGEARALLKCLRSGVNVPGIRMVDASAGLLGIEWIEGMNVNSVLLGGGVEDDNQEKVSESSGEQDPLSDFGISSDTLMLLIGTEIGKMHVADVIHGDLTTSNMMLRHPSSLKSADPSLPTELVLIDFGLSYQSGLVEDKAVDLYVLERAFASTHPDSEPMFASVLSAYAKILGNQWLPLHRRLQEVRMRGRKRSMVG